VIELLNRDEFCIATVIPGTFLEYYCNKEEDKTANDKTT
jgi:hypothetical protein